MDTEPVKKERKPRPQGLSRIVSSRADKIAALQEIRRKCENGLIIREAHIMKDYGVHHTVSRLLKEGIIVPNGSPHTYKWVSPLPIPELVDKYWSLHGSVPRAASVTPPVKKMPVQEGETKPLEQVDVAKKSVDIADIAEKFNGRGISYPMGKLDIEAAAKHSTEMQHKRLQEELSTCLYMCKEYGISNVAKYIADVLIRKGFRFQ